jgi:hypothetical protein
MDVKDAPLMITYTGKYRNDENALVWWGNSPLVVCLLLKNICGKPQMCLLNELTEEEKVNSRNVLSCKEYTSYMLISFIDARLKERCRAAHKEY